MQFINLSKSLVESNAPAWQNEIIERVERDYSEQAKQINADFRAAVLRELSDERKLAGPVIAGIRRKVPRFAWIKNIEADGATYDVQIDLLECCVVFQKI